MRFLALILAVLAPDISSAQDSADLSQYKTVETAVRAAEVKAVSGGLSGYLGVFAEKDAKGRVVVTEIDANSPAAKAGLKPNDVVVKIADRAVDRTEVLRDVIQSQPVGADLAILVNRQGAAQTIRVKLDALSRPMKISTTEQRAVLGIRVGEPKEKSVEGVSIEEVSAGSPAAAARIKPGDLLLKVDGVPVNTSEMLRETLSDRNPEDSVVLTLRWEGKPVEVKVTLAAEPARKGFGFGKGKSASWDSRIGNYWKKPTYKVAIIGIEYPDVKHNPKAPPAAWEESMFSVGQYRNKNSATGQTVYGSMADYYLEQSFQKLKVEGKMFPWIEVGKKRGDYAAVTQLNKTALLTEAMDKLLARDGKKALDGYDGVFFIYAGDRFPTNRGGLYWPHRANVLHNGKRWSYFICPEGGQRMTNISVFCHEFGHMLGLPDLYARPENPGSEGVGAWCAMSNQVGNGKPQHFCAWSKEKLGWVTPAVIDPTVKQKLILAPIEDSPKECIKVLVKSDGSEYFLLENRKKKGFDASLPAEGLLIWRVLQNRPVLEESHGIDGALGPRVNLQAVPFPSSANSAFTPFTTPSSRSQLGGGLPVFLTNIRRLPDGRVAFHVGYEFN